MNTVTVPNKQNSIRQTTAQFIRFGIVGVSGTIVDFSIYALLTRVGGMYYIGATAISVLLAIVNNFFWNKHWTFRRGQSGQTRQESVKFFIVSAANYFLNIGITYGIVEYTTAERLFGSQEDFFAKIIAIGIVLFGNFFGNKYWTFKDH